MMRMVLTFIRMIVMIGFTSHRTQDANWFDPHRNDDEGLLAVTAELLHLMSPACPCPTSRNEVKPHSNLEEKIG